MAIYHNNIEICSGSKGGSAVASAAYQSATKLYSEQDREAKDYTRKENVLDSGIIKPENAPDWCLDRERLWNEVEKKEGIDGRYCRKHDLALPQELNFEQQQELVKKYCLELSKQGMVCDYAIHNNKSGTNPHCHILTTDRAFDEDKTREEHLKEMRKNIKEIIKTPINVIKDILTNPITAIFKLPVRAMEAFSNAVQAGAQLVAASTKNQPHQQAPVRKAWR